MFHLAGRVQRSGDRDALYALHVDGTANVLRAMKATGVRRVVLASTSGTVAVSPDAVVHNDDSPYAMEVVKGWPYYHSKVFAEQVASQMAESLDLELITLRPSLLLGPEDYRKSSTEDIYLFMKGDFPVAPEGGLCFVDVRDCARTFARAMRMGRPGDRWLLGGANMTFRDFFTLVCHIADVDPPIATVRRPLWRLGVATGRFAGRMGWVEAPDPIAMEMAHHYWYADWSRAVAELGHTPRSPIETLEDTVAWLQAYGSDDRLDGSADPGKLLRLPWRPVRREG